MKIYTLPADEDWICDRFTNEWNKEHPKMVEVHKTSKETILKENEFETVSSPKQADLIWLLSDWRWRHVDPISLAKKKVICTVHHIVPDKFGEAAKKDFKQRDEFVNAYHVPCELTKKQIENLTDKPIYCFPFWVNQNIWFPKNKYELRTKYKIEEEAFLIGSFQRDTEGKDLKTPKKEKGPDVFCDLVIALHKMEPKIEVLLGGWRRQYIMNRLYDAGVKYHFYKLPPFSVLNDFYNMLDLYIVGSRYEGGPQAVFECAATRTPIISTTAGYAPELLHENCMIDKGATWRHASSEETLDYNFGKVQELFIPHGFSKFEQMIRQVYYG